MADEKSPSRISHRLFATSRSEMRSKMKKLRIKSARAAKDMSQQALADLVGVSRQTINAIEKGDYNPTIKLCLAICKVLDKTLDELFWED